MKRMGQIDQIITNLVVFFAVFFLMFIFVVVSGNIGALRINDKIDSVSYPIAEKIILESFLIEEIDYEGGIFVVEAFQNISRVSKDEKIVLAKMIEERFQEVYSCGDRNKLAFLVRDDSNFGGSSLTFGNDDDLWRVIYFAEETGSKELSDGKVYSKQLQGTGIYVAVKGRNLC